MARTGGPRGHGPGRSANPAAEAARREKIRTAALKRKSQIRVLIVADYRNRGRTKEGHTSKQTSDWSYVNGRSYPTRIDPSIATNRNALAAHLDRLKPNRVHYRVRVAEYL
jgi:hypothetical protein